MTSRDFCYWLRGYFDVGHVVTEGMTAVQVECVARQLGLVLKHGDPSMEMQHSVSVPRRRTALCGCGRVLDAMGRCTANVHAETE